MKITDPKVIQSGEMAFLNAVKDHLDWDAIRQVVVRQMHRSRLSSEGGELVVRDNNVAFKIDVHCELDVGIVFDRNGNLVSEIPGERDVEVPRVETKADPAGQPIGGDEALKSTAVPPAPETEVSTSKPKPETPTAAAMTVKSPSPPEPTKSASEPKPAPKKESTVLELDDLLSEDEGLDLTEPEAEEDGILELNDLLADEDTGADEAAGVSDAAKKATDDDGDLDLDDLFFKEKELDDSGLDDDPDDDGGFWEENK